jgi:hypothetical protein
MGKISKEDKYVISNRYSLLVKAISKRLPWPWVPLGAHSRESADSCLMPKQKSHVSVDISLGAPRVSTPQGNTRSQ